MQLEVGNIVEGKVTGITKFGAFVELPGGKTGMVHISEVASTYVKEISDHLAQGQEVKVKILSISGDGKVSLSIKQCQEAPQQQPGPRKPYPPRESRPRESRPQNRGWQPKRQQPTEGMSFEDMLSKFKQTSDDKMSDIRRSTGETRRARRGASR